MFDSIDTSTLGNGSGMNNSDDSLKVYSQLIMHVLKNNKKIFKIKVIDSSLIIDFDKFIANNKNSQLYSQRINFNVNRIDDSHESPEDMGTIFFMVKKHGPAGKESYIYMIVTPIFVGLSVSKSKQIDMQSDMKFILPKNIYDSIDDSNLKVRFMPYSQLVSWETGKNILTSEAMVQVEQISEMAFNSVVLNRDTITENLKDNSIQSIQGLVRTLYLKNK